MSQGASGVTSSSSSEEIHSVFMNNYNYVNCRQDMHVLYAMHLLDRHACTIYNVYTFSCSNINVRLEPNGRFSCNQLTMSPPQASVLTAWTTKCLYMHVYTYYVCMQRVTMSLHSKYNYKDEENTSYNSHQCHQNSQCSTDHHLCIVIWKYAKTYIVVVACNAHDHPIIKEKSYHLYYCIGCKTHIYSKTNFLLYITYTFRSRALCSVLYIWCICIIMF